MYLTVAEAVHASNGREGYFADPRIKEGIFEKDIKKKFEKLCTYENGTMNYATFRNSSTSCKLVRDGKNPLIRIKMEELRSEPVVQLVHDFISTAEIKELLTKISKYEFENAPTIAEEEDEESLTIRAALSHYINEEEDNVATISKTLKDR